MWQLMPEGTTLDDIEWNRITRKTRTFVKSVKASKSDEVYEIYKVGDKYECSCPGAKYHTKMCKHVKQITESTV